MAALNELVWSVRNSVGSLILNRPDSLNAISKQMWDSLPLVLKSIKDEGAKVIVVSGSGNAFASGADLGELERLDSYAGARQHWFAIRDCLNSLWSFELPTIAMINGPCLGGGCLLALACDLRFASHTSSFGIPISKLGIVLDDANVRRLIGAVGPLFAKEMLLVGRTVTSARAVEIGLVNASVAAEALEQHVETVAAQIAGNVPISMMQAKASVNRALFSESGSAIQDEEVVIQSYLGQEFRERLEKRGNK